jgi:hypothetical protein
MFVVVYFIINSVCKLSDTHSYFVLQYLSEVVAWGVQVKFVGGNIKSGYITSYIEIFNDGWLGKCEAQALLCLEL